MARSLDVVVLGASGHGMVVCDILLSGGEDTRVIGFADADPSKRGTQVLGLTVIGAIDDLRGRDDLHVAMGIGDNAARRREFVRLAALGLRPVTVVHPSAVVSARAAIGRGTVIMANVTINVAAEIGDNVILNTASSIDHHCVVGAHSHIAPGATLAGNVRIADETLVGAGAVILPGISIGAHCTVAAGAVVTGNVPDGVTVAGVPARVISSSASVPRNVRV